MKLEAREAPRKKGIPKDASDPERPQVSGVSHTSVGALAGLQLACFAHLTSAPPGFSHQAIRRLGQIHPPRLQQATGRTATCCTALLWAMGGTQDDETDVMCDGARTLPLIRIAGTSNRPEALSESKDKQSR